MARCGRQVPNCAMPTKTAKQQDIGVTGGRKWEAMARKWSEQAQEKESEECATCIYDNVYTTKTIMPSFECFLSVYMWLTAAGTRTAIRWVEAAIKCQNMQVKILDDSTNVVQLIGFLIKKITSDYGTHIFDRQYSYGPVPVAAQSKAQVYGCSPAVIVGLNPTRGMDVCLLCCVLSGRGLCDKLITNPEKSYRLWCVVCDLEKQNLVNEEAKTHLGAIAPRESEREKKYILME